VKRALKIAFAILFFGGALVFSLDQSNSFNRCVRDEIRHERYYEAEEDRPAISMPFRPRISCAVAFADDNSGMLTFIVGLLVLFVYRRQANLMHGQLKAAIATANAAEMQARKSVLDMRANMAPGFPKTIGPNIDPLDVRVIVTNAGAAPGVLGNTYAAFWDTLPSNPVFDKSVMECFPDQTTLRVGDPPKFVGTFSPKKKTAGQYFYGIIEYRDAIGRWRRRFCVQVLEKPVGTNIWYPAPIGDAYNGTDYEGE